MGFFSSIKKSWKKSGNLQKLQKDIDSASRGSLSHNGKFLSTYDFSVSTDEKKQLMDRYIDEICLQDEGVVKVINEYGLSRDDLYRYYTKLSMNGLGQWIEGHYAALSTIAYYEPLLYLVESEKRGVPLLTIYGNLLEYWKGTISQGGLLKMV